MDTDGSSPYGRDCKLSHRMQIVLKEYGVRPEEVAILEDEGILSVKQLKFANPDGDDDERALFDETVTQRVSCPLQRTVVTEALRQLLKSQSRDVYVDQEDCPIVDSEYGTIKKLPSALSTADYTVNSSTSDSTSAIASSACNPTSGETSKKPRRPRKKRVFTVPSRKTTTKKKKLTHDDNESRPESSPNPPSSDADANAMIQRVFEMISNTLSQNDMLTHVEVVEDFTNFRLLVGLKDRMNLELERPEGDNGGVQLVDEAGQGISPIKHGSYFRSDELQNDVKISSMDCVVKIENNWHADAFQGATLAPPDNEIGTSSSVLAPVIKRKRGRPPKSAATSSIKRNRGRQAKSIKVVPKKTAPLKSREPKIISSNRFKCYKCDKIFVSCSGLRLHQKNGHGKSKIYNCVHCHLKFKSKLAVTLHKKKDHLGSINSKKTNRYNCEMCDFHSDESVEMQKHHRSKEHRINRSRSDIGKHGGRGGDPNGTYPCPHCPLKFRTLGARRQHRWYYHPECGKKASVGDQSSDTPINSDDELIHFMDEVFHSPTFIQAADSQRNRRSQNLNPTQLPSQQPNSNFSSDRYGLKIHLKSAEHARAINPVTAVNEVQ